MITTLLAFYLNMLDAIALTFMVVALLFLGSRILRRGKFTPE